MKTKYILITFAFVLLASCSKETKNNDTTDNEISVTKRILSKLHLIKLDEGLIQKQKIKEAYDLLKIVEYSNKKTIDTVAKNQIYMLFNNDVLAKSFVENEASYLNNGYGIDSIKINMDTILVRLKKENAILKRKFVYKLIKDSIIDKNLPPTVVFKVLDAKYFDEEIDTISITQ